jgi:hypothetical protein
LIALKIVEGIDFFKDKNTMIRHHNENFDGSGYPDGLVEEAIPLEARIIPIADAFDAMTSGRPHREAMPIMDVIVEMGFGVKFRLPADFKWRLIEWQIPDPYLLDRTYFRDVRDLIESEVRRLLATLAGDSGHGKMETGRSKTETGKSKMETGKPKIENRNSKIEER